MKYIQDTRVILAALVLVIVIIKEVGKSIRINQLKNIEKTRIESMGQYEKNSKDGYLKVFETNKKIEE
ncbi:hypothetical protein [Algibacter sp. 2305UL17-15]|uniref:hypothetical protein n=1 Tax=Algibacter sp. 2305UL17-15 TaxID=3231268 RepID=UPI00345A7815